MVRGERARERVGNRVSAYPRPHLSSVPLGHLAKAGSG